jgi:hypothetical protein
MEQALKYGVRVRHTATKLRGKIIAEREGRVVKLAYGGRGLIEAAPEDFRLDSAATKKQVRYQASQSFRKVEIGLLEKLMKDACIGSGLLARHPAYSGLARKINAMKKRFAYLEANHFDTGDGRVMPRTPRCRE